MRERATSLVLSAEHASNRIPAAFREVAQRAGATMETHRGFDPGTAELGRVLAKQLRAPLFLGRWSRLLIELNRSPHHRHLWSEFSHQLSAGQKTELLHNYYHPHRNSVADAVRAATDRGHFALHISLHSFTPALNGERRNADVGLLYDPGRPREVEFCEVWRRTIAQLAPGLKVRRNYPYRGVADGLTTHFRRRFPGDRYAGIELEVNQKFPLDDKSAWRALQRTLAESLRKSSMELR